jgi:Undecaprenyl-phosphate glucose phosphotransferase
MSDRTASMAMLDRAESQAAPPPEFQHLVEKGRASHRGCADASVQATFSHRDAGLFNARTLPAFVAAVEFVLVALAAFAASSLYHRAVFGQLPFAAFYFHVAFVLAALFVLPSGFSRDYSVKRLLERREQLRAVLLRWNSAYSLFVFGLFMMHATNFYSRGSIVAQYAAGLVTALLVRLLGAAAVARGLQSKRVRGRNVLVIGEAARVHDTVDQLCRHGKGNEIVGVIVLPPDRPPAFSPFREERPRNIAAQMNDVLPTVRDLMGRLPVDDIVLDLPWWDTRRIDALLECLAVVPAIIHLAPDPTWSWARDPVLARVGKMSTIRLAGAPLTLRDRVIKRVFDLTVASALLILALPFFAAIAFAIKLETAGPILFRQKRHGFNQREFRMLKFRTMTTLDDGPSVPQATRNDRRITKVGKILRRSNLDEIPQLVNVLAGHMSLVGPRPHAVAHNTEYEDRIRIYAQRHKVKPGITGLAQVHGHRGETDSIDKMVRRVEHDLLYIDRWSLFLDVKIMVMTLFSRRSYFNAY